MKKILILLTLTFLVYAGLKAQSHFDLQRKSELSIGLESALPMNGWDLYAKNTKSASFGAGLSLKYVYNINDFLATTTQIGALHFFANKLDGAEVNSDQFFLKAGIRLKAGSIYFEPECGISSLSGNVPDKINGGFGSSTINPFTYAMAIGALAGKRFDISFRYEAMTKDATVGYIGLRIAYKIPLGDPE